jgi:malate dehydrogenase
VKGTDPTNEQVPVVGGHSGVTIVPLTSQSNHPDISGPTLEALVNRIQFGGDEVVKAKDGAGSATLSMAMAGARFADSVIKASQGAEDVVECTFVDSPLYEGQGIDFFASKVKLGPNGVEEILPVGKISEYEQRLLDTALAELKKNIAKGEIFLSVSYPLLAPKSDTTK